MGLRSTFRNPRSAFRVFAKDSLDQTQDRGVPEEVSQSSAGLIVDRVVRRVRPDAPPAAALSRAMLSAPA